MTTQQSKLRIFKFGGASVRTAQGVENLASIVRQHQGPLVVVVSAMGKTTNALETILNQYLSNSIDDCVQSIQSLYDYHLQIVNSLGWRSNSKPASDLEEIFGELKQHVMRPPANDYNFCYDQLVSFGEVISTRIVSAYLTDAGIDNRWIDIRRSLLTDNNFREGNINFSVSEAKCKQAFQFASGEIYVTQGFIGGTADGYTTTLGREGSDYTAAILANLLNAASVSIWKDVDGVLNADPRIFENTVKLDRVSFKEAIELAYCGAQIIHPKTIKPLQNKQISLLVKSFVNPEASGTLVYQTDDKISYPPILILKQNQVLISLSPRDFSFVIEDCLSKIFAILYKHRVKANLVQNSAISFSICVDNEKHFLPNALSELGLDFTVRYNDNLALLTVRHYNDKVINETTMGREILLMQKTRSTMRVVYR